MSRRRQSWAPSALVFAAVAAASCSSKGTDSDPGTASPARRPLASGLRITYAVDLEPGGEREAALADLVRVVDRRLAKSGLGTWYATGAQGKLVVELPPSDDETISRAKDIISRMAKLEFKVVDDGHPFMRSIYARAFEDIQRHNPGKSDRSSRSPSAAAS